MLVWMRRVAHELLSRRAPMRRFIWLFVDEILCQIDAAERLAAGNNAAWTPQRCDNVRVRFVRRRMCISINHSLPLSYIYRYVLLLSALRLSRE